MAAGTAFQVSAIFRAFDKMSTPIGQINSRLTRFTKNMKIAQATTVRASFGMTGSIRSIATGMIGASVAFAIWDKAVVGTIRRGAQLESILTQTGAKFGKLANVIPGSAAFSLLEKAALKAGLTTEFTAIQSAEALKVLAAAGLGVGQAIKTLPIITDFATAAGLELARATSISADAIGAFGGNIADLDPEQLKAKMAKINNIMVVTANTFNTSVEEMFEASTSGGRVLTRLIGASGFQFAALVGTIATGGIKAEKAGRGIRAAFLKLTSEGGQKALKRLGISLTKQNGEFKDIITIVNELRTGLGGVKNQAQKLKLGNQLFGRVGLVQMDILLGRAKGKLEDVTRTMEAQGDEVTRIAKLVRSTLNVQWTIFISKMEALGQIVFTKVAPALKGIVQFLSSMATSMATVPGPMLEMIGLMLQLAGVILAAKAAMFVLNLVLARSPLFFVASGLILLSKLFPEVGGKILEHRHLILFLTIAFVSLSKAMAIARIVTVGWGIAVAAYVSIVRTAGAVMLAWNVITNSLTLSQIALNIAMFLNPIGLIVLGVLALIAAFVALVVWFDEITTFFTENWFDLVMLLNPFTLFLAILGKIFPNTIGKILTKIKNMFLNIFGGIFSFFSNLFGGDDEVEVNKNSKIDVEHAGEIVASPSAVAFGSLEGKIDVNFNNKPDNVTISKPETEGDTGLVLSTSGS